MERRLSHRYERTHTCTMHPHCAYMLVKNHTLISPRLCFFHAVEEATQQDGVVTDENEASPLVYLV